MPAQGDVYVKGYYRKDGTYVRPHYRSARDSYKWNNYGPSRTSNELLNPRLRDYDRDGVPNYLDRDDDNDGRHDDSDRSQYHFLRQLQFRDMVLGAREPFHPSTAL